MSAALAGLPYTFVLSPADSARAVARLYTVSLIATVPFVVAAVAAQTFRHFSARLCALVWRSAILALLIFYLAQLLPMQWMTGVVPAAQGCAADRTRRVATDGSRTRGAGECGAGAGRATVGHERHPDGARDSSVVLFSFAPERRRVLWHRPRQRL